MAEENVVEKTETTPAETTKENEETKTLEKTEKPEPTEAEGFKAELEKAQGIIGHKEDVIKTEKSKNEELEKKLEETGFDQEEIQAQVQEAIASQVDSLQKGFVTDAIDDEIDMVTGSPEETELIKFHFKNSVKLSGTTRKEIRRAVRTAKMLANEKKIMSNNTELAEALKASATTRTAPDGSGEKTQPEEKENLNTEEQALIDRYSTAGKKIIETAPATNVK